MLNFLADWQNKYHLLSHRKAQWWTRLHANLSLKEQFLCYPYHSLSINVRLIGSYNQAYKHINNKRDIWFFEFLRYLLILKHYVSLSFIMIKNWSLEILVSIKSFNSWNEFEALWNISLQTVHDCNTTLGCHYHSSPTSKSYNYSFSSFADRRKLNSWLNCRCNPQKHKKFDLFEKYFF